MVNIAQKYEDAARDFLEISRLVPDQVYRQAIGFININSDKDIEGFELDYVPQTWRSDRNFVEILADPITRDWIFYATEAISQDEEEAYMLLEKVKMRDDQEPLTHQVFCMICMAMVSRLFIMKLANGN